MMVNLEKLKENLRRAELEEMELGRLYEERAKKQQNTEIKKKLASVSKAHKAMATAFYEAQIIADESVE